MLTLQVFILVFRFDCEEPTMNVNINDDVKFLCPYTDGGFFMPPSAEKPMYENMYMVDSQQYESCNATGACYSDVVHGFR